MASVEMVGPGCTLTNPWTLTGSTLTVRTGAAAIMLKNGTALITGGTAHGRAVESAEFFVPSRNAFEPAPEAAPGAADAGATITVALLAPDGTVRASKTYRVPAMESVFTRFSASLPVG